MRSPRVILASTVASAVLALMPLSNVGPSVVHAAREPLGPKHGVMSAAGWVASNWSGYALSGSGYTAITGSWKVPAVAKSGKATYSSTWIGIDGFNNSSLIQTGTEQDYFSGAARYSAWWEILPAAETRINTLAVRPGDVMSASIARGTSDWTITLTDTTTGQSFSTVQTYTGPGMSAEWIQEAPTVNGRIASLANYGLATFDPGTVNGLTPAFVPSEVGVMVQGGVQVSTPSVPDPDADGFNVAYGSAAPAAPAS